MPSVPPPNPAIAELVEFLSEEDARDLVGMFIKNFPGALRTLETGTLEEQRRVAHGLKSSARIVGVLALSRRFAALETRLALPGGFVGPDDLATIAEEFAQAALPLKTFIGL